MKSDENPVFVKVPGSVNIGTEFFKGNRDSVENTVQPVPVTSDATKNWSKSTQKKRKLQSETEEIAQLSTSELQRLVLVERLRLTRLQIMREELLLKRLRESDTSTSSTQKEWVTFDDTDGVLKEFLILN